MLREYAYGFAQNAVQPVANFIAPTVEVGTMIGRFKQYDTKHAFHIPNTARPIGGRATEVTFGATDSTYNCSPHAIDVPVDELLENEAESLEDVMAESAAMAAQIAALQHEYRVITAAIAGCAGTGSGATISVAATDPIDTIDGHILNVLKAARYGSSMGARIVSGAGAFRLVKNCPTVRNRFVSDGRAAVPTSIPNITPDTLKSLLIGSPDTMISWMVQDTASEGKSASISFLMDTEVIIFAALATPTRRDPSFMKTFRLKGNWMIPGQYVRDDQRVTVAKFDWTEDVKVTNSAAGIKMTVTA
jgi:hypothetical protein